VDAFPDSFFVHSLNDVLLSSTACHPKTDCAICKFKNGRTEAKVLCIDCRVELCNGCAADHQKATVTETHTLLQLFGGTSSGGSGSSSGINRDNYCRVHKGETVKYYCETCNSPVCLPCTFIDHRGHNIDEIRRVRQQFSNDMESLVVQSEDNILQLQSARDDLAELENELFIRKEAIKAQIRHAAQELIRTINENEVQLVSEVEAFFDTVAVSADRQRVEKTIYRLQRAHDFARQLMASETSPITQLVNRSEAKDNLRQAQIYELPDLTVHLHKLDGNICFLPGHISTNVGTMVKCHSHGKSACNNTSHNVIVPSTVGAVNRAMFLRKLTATPVAAAAASKQMDIASHESLPEVVSIAFLPNSDCVMLGMTKKFVKIFDSSSGLVRLEFGDDDGSCLMQPSDMAVTRDGDLAITDCGLLCVKVFDTQGSLQLMFGGPDVFTLPIAVAIDSIGRFLVCDQAKQKVTVHRQHGELLQTLDIGELASPQHISVFANNVYIADSVNNVIAIYSYSNEGLQLVGKLSAGSSSPEFLDCSGICIDRTGNLLVSDSILNRIHVFMPNGQFGSLLASGRAFHRSACLAVSGCGLLAVAQQTGGAMDQLDVEELGDGTESQADQFERDCRDGSKYEVSIYRVIKADL
jgi:sugar lactone lactonase YvrE